MFVLDLRTKYTKKSVQKDTEELYPIAVSPTSKQEVVLNTPKTLPFQSLEPAIQSLISSEEELDEAPTLRDNKTKCSRDAASMTHHPEQYSQSHSPVCNKNENKVPFPIKCPKYQETYLLEIQGSQKTVLDKPKGEYATVAYGENQQVSIAYDNKQQVSDTSSNNQQVSRVYSINRQVSSAYENDQQVAGASGYNQQVSGAYSNNQQLSNAYGNDQQVAGASGYNQQVLGANGNNQQVAGARGNDPQVSSAYGRVQESLTSAYGKNQQVSGAYRKSEKEFPRTPTKTPPSLLSMFYAEEDGSPHSKVIIKTRNVSPLPDYDGMSTPELHAELDKFGIKRLRRRLGIQLLKYMYEYTHPVVSVEEVEEIERIIKERKHKKKTKTKESKDDSKDVIATDVSENSSQMGIVGEPFAQK